MKTKHLLNGVAVIAALALSAPVWAQPANPSGANSMGMPGPSPSGPGLTPIVRAHPRAGVLVQRPREEIMSLLPRRPNRRRPQQRRQSTGDDSKTRPFRAVRPLRRADGEPRLGSVLFRLGRAQRRATGAGAGGTGISNRQWF